MKKQNPIKPKSQMATSQKLSAEEIATVLQVVLYRYKYLLVTGREREADALGKILLKLTPSSG